MNMTWWLVPITLAVLLHAVVVGMYRASALEQSSKELNLSWNPEAVHWNEHTHFEMFRQGSRRVVYNRMMDQNGSLLCGDFKWTQYRFFVKQRLSFCLFNLSCPLPAERYRREELLSLC